MPQEKKGTKPAAKAGASKQEELQDTTPGHAISVASNDFNVDIFRLKLIPAIATGAVMCTEVHDSNMAEYVCNTADAIIQEMTVRGWL